MTTPNEHDEDGVDEEFNRLIQGINFDEDEIAQDEVGEDEIGKSDFLIEDPFLSDLPSSNQGLDAPPSRRSAGMGADSSVGASSEAGGEAGIGPDSGSEIKSDGESDGEPGVDPSSAAGGSLSPDGTVLPEDSSSPSDPLLEDPLPSPDGPPVADGAPGVAGTVKRRCLALILSPIDSAAALRAALDMVGSPAPVVSFRPGTAVYMEVDLGSPTEASEADEMAALLGEDRPLPKEVNDMAILLSKLSAQGAVALVSWLSEDVSAEEIAATSSEAGSAEDRAEKANGSASLEGNIVAQRFVSGEPEERLSAGLVLASINLAAEELLLGRITVDEIDSWFNQGPWTGWLKGRGRRR